MLSPIVGTLPQRPTAVAAPAKPHVPTGLLGAVVEEVALYCASTSSPREFNNYANLDLPHGHQATQRAWNATPKKNATPKRVWVGPLADNEAFALYIHHVDAEIPTRMIYAVFHNLKIGHLARGDDAVQLIPRMARHKGERDFNSAVVTFNRPFLGRRRVNADYLNRIAQRDAMGTVTATGASFELVYKKAGRPRRTGNSWDVSFWTPEASASTLPTAGAGAREPVDKQMVAVGPHDRLRDDCNESGDPRNLDATATATGAAPPAASSATSRSTNSTDPFEFDFKLPLLLSRHARLERVTSARAATAKIMDYIFEAVENQVGIPAMLRHELAVTILQQPAYANGGSVLALAVQSAISPELPAFVLSKARELLPRDERREFVFHRDLLGQGALGNAVRWLHPLYADAAGHLQFYSRVLCENKVALRGMERKLDRVWYRVESSAALNAMDGLLDLVEDAGISLDEVTRPMLLTNVHGVSPMYHLLCCASGVGTLNNFTRIASGRLMTHEPTFSAGARADSLRPHPPPRPIEPVGKVSGNQVRNTPNTLSLADQRGEVCHGVQALAACNRVLRDQLDRMSLEQVAEFFCPPSPGNDSQLMPPFMLALRAEVETAVATCQMLGQLPSSTVHDIVTTAQGPSPYRLTALHVAAMCPSRSFEAFRDLVFESEMSDEQFRHLVLARVTAQEVRAQNYYDEALMGALPTEIFLGLEQSALQLAAQSDPRTFELMLDLLVDQQSQGGLVGRLAGPTLAASRLTKDELRSLLLGIESPACDGAAGRGGYDRLRTVVANKPVLQLLLERGDASALMAWKLLVDQLELATAAEFSAVLQGPSAGDMLRSALIGGDPDCVRLYFEWICEHWIDAEANHIEGLVARSSGVLVSCERLVPSLAAELTLKYLPRPYGETGAVAPNAGALDDETLPATIRVGLPPGASVLTIAALDQSGGGMMQTTLDYLKIIGEVESHELIRDARASVLLPLFEDFDNEATWSPLLALLSNSTVSVETFEAFLDSAYETALAATDSPDEAARRMWGIMTAQNRLGVSPHHVVLAVGTPAMYRAFLRRAVEYHPDGLLQLFLAHTALPAPTLPEMPGFWNLLHTGATGGRFVSASSKPARHLYTLDRTPALGGAHSMAVLAMANKQQPDKPGCFRLLLAAMTSVIEAHGAHGVTAVTNAIYDTAAGRSRDGQVESYAFRASERPSDDELATQGAWQVVYNQAMHTADPDSITELHQVMAQCLGSASTMEVHRRAFPEAVGRADPDVLAAYFDIFVRAPGTLGDGGGEPDGGTAAGRLGQLFRQRGASTDLVERRLRQLFNAGWGTLVADILDGVAGGHVSLERVPGMLTILLNHIRGELSSHMDETEAVVATLLMTPIYEGHTPIMLFARMPGGGPSLRALAAHFEVLTDAQLERLLMYENIVGHNLFRIMGIANTESEHVAAVLQAAARLSPEAVREALLMPDSKGKVPFATAFRTRNGVEVNRLFAQYRETAAGDTKAGG